MKNRHFVLFPIFALMLSFLVVSACNQSESAETDTVLIPAGPFLMGSPSESALHGQSPAREVYLDAYFIDKHEVTIQEYERFIQEGGYRNKKFWTKAGWKFIEQNQIQGYLAMGQPITTQSNYGLYNAPNQPIIGISWYEADAYCRWAGKRLPTEAEWEKAARGTEGFLYPWGNKMNFENLSYRVANGRRTVPVGSFPTGASPYGIVDMAGNVWEWCSDWYDKAYYTKSPSRNPKGPKSGMHRVLRGGGWGATRLQLRSTYRYYDLPTYRGFNAGCRCVKDAN